MLLYNLLLCSGARCPHRELALLLLRRLLREPHARRHLHPLLDRSEPVSRLRTTWCNLFGQGFTSVGKPRVCSGAVLRSEPVSRPLFSPERSCQQAPHHSVQPVGQSFTSVGKPRVCSGASLDATFGWGSSARGNPDFVPSRFTMSIHKMHILACVSV